MKFFSLENIRLYGIISVVSINCQSFGASKTAAKQHFEFLYEDKTGNVWGGSKDSFVKRPHKFYPLEIDYGVDEGAGQQVGGISPGSKSLLAPEVQSLIRMIFDVESMKKAMLEFEVSCVCIFESL